MKPYQLACIVVATLLLLQPDSIEAKRRKHKGKDGDHHDSHRSKTKTKWSTSTDLGGSDAQVATEEHGYYVKRTYSPQAGIDGKRKSPPYLAIPIAWFNCAAGKEGCQQASNSAAINSPAHALSEGYLCDDDCEDGYEPICGQTPNEVAVFYNKCKLNVAKCRTHGLWTDLPYEQCKETYPKETAYTEKKFRCSPFFRNNSTKETQTEEAQKIEHDQIETEIETETEPEKEKDSNESSEEEQDKKKNKNKNKNENKDEKEDKEETLEPIALALQAKPVEVPVPAPIEAIALPPLPVKTTPERQPEPVIVKGAESKPEIQAQSEPQTETESQPQIPTQTKPQIPTQTKPQIPTQTKPQIPTQTKPQTPTQTKPQIQGKPQPLPALIQSQIQQQVQQHIQSQFHAQTKPQTEKRAETENQTPTENKAQTENLIQPEELTQPPTDAQISPVKTVEHTPQAAKVTKPSEAAIVSKDKLKYVVS